MVSGVRRFGLMCAVVLWVCPAWAQQVTAHVAQLINLQGTASVQRGGTGSREPLTVGTYLAHGDKVSVGPEGAARIIMSDKSLLDLAPGTVLTLQAVRKTDAWAVRLHTWVGSLWARVMPRARGDADFVVEGPNAVAGVRGTSFVVAVSAEGDTRVSTLTGAVQVNDASGHTLLVRPYQQAVAQGHTPLSMHAISSNDVAQLRRNTTPTPSLNRDTVAQRLQVARQALLQHDRDSLTHRDSGSLQNRFTPPTTRLAPLQPPLLIDPGTRLTHVRAQIELNP